MKNVFLCLITIGLCMTMMAEAQEFDKSLASAKSAYNSGDLEDARFNLENALREIDAAIGREILKVLPTSLGGLNSDSKNDQVTGMSGGLTGGLYVHREYGNQNKSATVDIISDSPLMAGVNAILSMPMIMNSGDSNQKVVKVQGYKSLLTREVDDNNQTSGYPFGSSLLTLDYNGAISEADLLKVANSLPLEKIIALAQ